ncbi:cyanase [Nitrospira moscoviensis]|uniref:Cyanate hydratase n=1 Tax=Nitrospira moscoviensis TaxID=42253 RepID=A0A0K2GAS4_NITMO|nr:cyanase [Nitrospira moscoviensis]ALA57702.1 Cyanate hydratase [Nitrospira moscoviensis]
MDKETVRTAVKAKRLKKNITIADVAKVVGKNPTFVAAALNGNHRFTPDEAKKVGALLELDGPTTEALSKFPVRADYPNTTDPFKYRLLEIIGVYGDSLREQANEMFGDGIMSAIDFSLDMEKVTGSQGEARCKITLNGKWLEYKTF